MPQPRLHQSLYERPVGRLRSWPIDLALMLTAFGICAAILGGLLSLTGMIESDQRVIGEFGWYCDLLINFQFPYAVAIVALAPILALRRLWKCLAVLLACAAPVAAMLWPYLPPIMRQTGASAETITIASVNLWFDRLDPERLRNYLRETGVDVVILTEATARWSALLVDDYPYRVSNLSMSGSWFGVVLLSRHRIEAAHEVLRELPISGVAGRICRSGASGCVTVIGIHAPVPIPRARSLRRDQELLAVGAAIAATGSGAVVLAGDFNATPWTRGFRALLDRAQLRDSAEAELRPTWNSRWLAAMIPIDHILHSAELRVVQRSTGPDLGSDHLPVVARLAW